MFGNNKDLKIHLEEIARLNRVLNQRDLDARAKQQDNERTALELRSENERKLADLKSQHAREILDLKKENEHLTFDVTKKLSDENIELTKQCAVLTERNAQLEKMTDINADIVDVKDIINQLIKALPKIDLKSLTVQSKD